MGEEMFDRRFLPYNAQRRVSLLCTMCDMKGLLGEGDDLLSSEKSFTETAGSRVSFPFSRNDLRRRMVEVRTGMRRDLRSGTVFCSHWYTRMRELNIEIMG
jgi:hypothetical protein